ncbi:MAG: hypothetical protein ACW98A_12485 [Candidatus Hodarchaeales archaeon]|jgi:hypothetical protein
MNKKKDYSSNDLKALNLYISEDCYSVKNKKKNQQHLFLIDNMLEKTIT